MTAELPSLGEPVRITGPAGPWNRVGEELAARGTALLYSRPSDWPPADEDDPALRLLLGREWARFRSLAHPQVRDRFAASRSLIKQAVGAALESPPESVELAYSANGRPYLRGCDQLDISLSHTEEMLLFGLTSHGLLGVDVEQSGRRLVSGGAPPHICTPYEQELLLSLPEPERDGALVRMWTLKEAYTKAIGQGMRFRFNGFAFGLDDEPIRVLRPDGSAGSGSEWRFRTYRLGDRHCAGVALYDAGFGGQPDTAAGTMLDEELLSLLTR
jgi:4'-phosphopantetheinyl transferase